MLFKVFLKIKFIINYVNFVGVYFNPMYTWITMETQEEGSLASLSVAFIFCLGNIGSLLGPQVYKFISIIFIKLIDQQKRYHHWHL